MISKNQRVESQIHFLLSEIHVRDENNKEGCILSRKAESRWRTRQWARWRAAWSLCPVCRCALDAHFAVIWLRYTPCIGALTPGSLRIYFLFLTLSFLSFNTFHCSSNSIALMCYVATFLARNLVSASQDGKLIVWDSYTTNKVLFQILIFNYYYNCIKARVRCSSEFLKFFAEQNFSLD